MEKLESQMSIKEWRGMERAEVEKGIPEGQASVLRALYANLGGSRAALASQRINDLKQTGVEVTAQESGPTVGKFEVREGKLIRLSTGSE